MPPTPPRCRPGEPTTGRPARGPSTAPGTTPPTCATRIACAWRSSHRTPVDRAAPVGSGPCLRLLSETPRSPDPMAVRVGINGFGRIGRNFFRAAKAANADIDFVAVNDLTDAKTLAHFLKCDSTLGPDPGPVELDGDAVVADGDRLQVLAECDPAALPWG